MELKDELKGHTKYKGLHSQSSQRFPPEPAEAFNSWYGSADERDNPPGYRKRNYYDQDGNRVHEEHPRSTVTWKQNGIRHDTKNNRVRLSKGANHKEYPKAWEYLDLHGWAFDRFTSLLRIRFQLLQQELLLAPGSIALGLCVIGGGALGYLESSRLPRGTEAAPTYLPVIAAVATHGFVWALISLIP